MTRRTSATKRISGAAYNSLRTALGLVFWYKSTLERYLRATLRDHPELLVGINFNSKKREIADDLVERLIKKENLYQQVTVQLMIELANMQRFPELEQHDDSAK